MQRQDGRLEQKTGNAQGVARGQVCAMQHLLLARLDDPLQNLVFDFPHTEFGSTAVLRRSAACRQEKGSFLRSSQH